MDIERYAQRVKFRSLPADFNHQEGAKFDSSYEYSKTLSNYHHDKWRRDLPYEWWEPLGRFEGSWEYAVPKIIEKSQELDWEDITAYGLRPGFKGGQSPMVEQEKNDRARRGLANTEYTQVVIEEFIDEFPEIKRMVDHWHLENVTYRVHVQMPGQTFAPHIDKLWHRCPEDPARIVRIIVNLTDYEPGQILMYGTEFLTQWRAGDIHIFDTLNVPHATINLSEKPRPNMTITGLRTPEFDRIIAGHGADTRIKV